MRQPKVARAALLLTLLALAAGTLKAARAQTSYPMVTSVFPVACRRGETTEVTVTGRFNFAGAYGVLFASPGLSAEVAPTDPAKPADSVKLKITAAAEAPLGPQEFRVATPRGLSSAGVLVITTQPGVQESEGNNTPAAANPVSLPAAISGRIGANEDVDCYRFTVQAGQEVVFHILSARLQDRIHDLNPGSGGAHSDPILVLLDESGRELAAGDDYWGPDPLLIHRFDRGGAYVLQVRDVRYLGNPGWTYCLTATREPYLTAIYPMAGRRGTSVEVRPAGANLGGMQQALVEVPMRDPGPMDFRLRTVDGFTNPMPLLVSDLPQILETEGNDTPDGATPAAVPGGWNGRIEAENDVDCFRFRAAKGRGYVFEVMARRYGSSLDPFVQVLDAAGKPLANNDDALGKDSRLDWTCPADGEYLLQIRDLHSRGGETYVYHLAAAPVRPDFTLRCDDDKALVGPGGGYAMYVHVTRRGGFAGEVRLAVEGLPAEVTVSGDRIPAGMTQACVLFRAAPGAKPSFHRIRIVGTAEVPAGEGGTEPLRREAVPQQEIYVPGGGRSLFPVETHAVSITEPADVLLKLSTTRVTLKPGEAATIEVEITRQRGYKGAVNLDVYLRHLGSVYGNPLPPGVTLDQGNSKTLLSPAETKGRITLRAAANAGEIEDLPIAILGQVSINFVVKISHASEPVLLTVKK